jgi:PAS domain S-box-containing protein
MDDQSGQRAATSDLPYYCLLEKLPAGAYLCDAQGLITYYNRQAAQMWGREPTLLDAVDRFCGSLRLYRTDGAPIRHDECWMAHALRTGAEYDGEEIVIERSDGSRITVLAHVSPIRDQAGQLLGAVNVLVDISDRKRAEAVLSESEQRFAKFMQHLPGLAWIKDLNGRYVFVNDAAERAFRRPRAELHGLRDEELFPPETAVQFRENDRQALASTGGIETIETLEQEDGWHHSLVSKFPIPGPDGQPALIGGIAIDITQRIHMEQALRTSERLYRAIGESIDYGVWVCDPAGRNIYASESLLRMTGLTQEECSNLGWGSALHPDDAEATIAAWKQCVASGKQWDREHRFRSADGSWRPVLARGVPVRNEQGEITAWAGINLDISRLKQVEDRLREADRRKDEFLAMLAHELRNPLAPLSNALNLLRLSDDLSPTANRMREIMEQQVNQLIHLVDDLLEVSRITRGKIELRKELVDLAAVVRGAVETSRPLIEAAGHQLAIVLPPEPVILNADPVRLTQVIANLLNNAAKYTDDGGQIWLTARPDGDEIAISVRDNGMGIPAETLPHIFDLFAQGDGTAHRTEGGLGIGLTLARSLVLLHGGRIEARSAGRNSGSEFVVHLPRTVVDAHPVHAMPCAPQVRTDLPVRKVLVVDDAQAAAFTLGRLLEKIGQQVRTVHDGTAALAEALAERPDVVISDIAMPVMDGYELARRLRQQPELTGVVLVALTGYGQDSDRRRAAEVGFDFHLVKPVSLDTLRNLLDSLPATQASRTTGPISNPS